MGEANGHRIYSCDDHLDIHNMPRDAWTSRLARKHYDAAPHVVERGGMHLWMAGDQVLGPSGRTKLVPSALERVPDLEDDGFRPSDPRLRMQDMERDRIYASIVYGPQTLLGYPIADPVVKREVLRAWNDWAAEEFNAYLPDRLSALAALPATSPEDAVAELHRALGMGHRGAIFYCFEARVEDASWDVLWSAAEEADIPISFHIGGGSRMNPRIQWERAVYAAIAPLQLDEQLAIMIYSGVLERHPRLKLVLAESGVGWIPYFVARMDATFEKHCAPHPDRTIRTLPSEMFRRQVYATFEEEPLGPQLIPLLSPDNFMWACDYPHPDSTWPESRVAIEHSLGSLGEDAVRKVTGENCRALYDLG